MRKLFILIPVIAILIVVVAGVIWKNNCDKFLQNTYVNGQYIIEKGASYDQIIEKLFGEHQTPKGFSVYLTKVLKVDTTLHYGYYEADNINLATLLHNVSKGKQTLVKVTFPEGYNMYDIASALEKTGISTYDEMMKVFKDREYIREITGNSYVTIEGFLSPGTYFFSKNYPPKKIASTMVKQFYETLPKDFEIKARSLGLSFYDALILSSIIQKETYDVTEAPIVSSVFHNRIKRKMLIQADPTIIYGIYEQFDGKIRRSDLDNKDNLFNTYKHAGLTPTPIANPSAISLDAVVNPADTSYLYFVATKDGKHLFSRTYAEHQAKVNKHQR